MLYVPAWGEIAKRKQDDGETTCDDVQVIVPAPGLFGVGDEFLRDDTTECGEGKCSDKNSCINERTRLVRHEFGDNECEG